MTDIPICGYCGQPEHWHTLQDHKFNAVGGEATEEFKRDLVLYGTAFLRAGKVVPAHQIDLSRKPLSLWGKIAIAAVLLCAAVQIFYFHLR